LRDALIADAQVAWREPVAEDLHVVGDVDRIGVGARASGRQRDGEK
jgi:hypothetical protein